MWWKRTWKERSRKAEVAAVGQDVLLTLREHILYFPGPRTLKSDALRLRHAGLEMPGQRGRELQSIPEAEQSRSCKRSSLAIKGYLARGSPAAHSKPLYHKRP